MPYEQPQHLEPDDDIYYRDPVLFGTQSVVDRLVGKLAASLQIERYRLGVVASPRGLVSGDLVFTYPSVAPERHEATLPGTPTLIPLQGMQGYKVATEARWLLIVEKEASFRRLADLQRDDEAWLQEGIIVTAKGYPDHATTAFVAALAERYPSMPRYALVDGGPIPASSPHATRPVRSSGSVYAHATSTPPSPPTSPAASCS
ncbi:endodeoxyribonuclease [Thecaphora frezii]